MDARHLLTGPAVSSELEERQQVGIDRVRFRSGHAMREVVIGFQGPADVVQVHRAHTIRRWKRTPLRRWSDSPPSSHIARRRSSDSLRQTCDVTHDNPGTTVWPREFPISDCSESGVAVNRGKMPNRLVPAGRYSARGEALPAPIVSRANRNLGGPRQVDRKRATGRGCPRFGVGLRNVRRTINALAFSAAQDAGRAFLSSFARQSPEDQPARRCAHGAELKASWSCQCDRPFSSLGGREHELDVSYERFERRWSLTQ